MEIIKKLVHILSIVTYVLVVFFYLIICVPATFKYYPLSILTSSMEPTFERGSIVYYKKVPENELKVGDVISFSNDSDIVVTHRIVNIENGLIETKGDSNDLPDIYKVRYKDIKGRNSNISIPYLGYCIRVDNRNLTIIVVFLVLILISEYLFSNKSTLGINRIKKGRRNYNENNK